MQAGICRHSRRIYRKILVFAGWGVLAFFVFFHSRPIFADTSNSPGVPKVLKSASELDYPPFAVVQPGGGAGGFSVDLLKAAAEAAGLTVTFKVGPWQEIKEELAAGRLDVLPLMSNSAERRAFFDFTVPYLKMKGAVFVRKGNTEIRRLADLAGKEVLVMRGDTAHEYVEREGLTDKIFPVVSYEEAFRLLSQGDHDAVVVQQVVGLQIIKTLGLKNIVPAQQKDIATLKPVVMNLEGFEQKFSFAVQKGKGELLSVLNEGLAIVHLNGTYELLYEKWFAPILPKPQPSLWEYLRILVIVLVPLAFTLSLFAVWYFKRLVTKKTEVLRQEIRQRRQMERELENINTKYLHAQQLSKIGNWDYDLETHVFSGSAEALKIFGLDSEASALTVEEVESCIPERERVHQALLDLIERDVPYNVEYDIITKSRGERRTILSLAEVERDASGNPVCIHGVIRDVTDRRKAEAALRKSERLLNEMGALARIGGWEHDLSAHTATWTEETYRIVEIDSGPAPGPNEHLRYYPPEDRAILEKAYRHARETGEAFDIEVQCNSAKGRRFWARVIGRPTFVNGKCVKISGIFQDITQRRQAEDMLRKSEGQFRTLVKTIPDLVWLKDKDGVFLACNQRFEDFLGVKETDAIGKTDYDFVDRRLADSFREHDLQATAAGRPLTNEEWLTFASDGRRALHETIKTPMYDDQGLLIGVLGIARDITERRRAEEERLKLESRLQQNRKLEAIGVLAGGIAHDFNNILSSLLGFAELARQNDCTDPQLREDLNEIYAAGNRAKELVEQILTFSRRKKPKSQLVQIPAIVNEAIRLLQPTIPASIAIQVAIDDNIQKVSANPSQLLQAIMNLCSNAVHAMEDTGGVLTIKGAEVSPSDDFFSEHRKLAPGSYIAMIFQDTGTGIAPSLLSSIFDPYFTTKNYGDGTGLGLAATYGIVRDVGGEIEVRSEPGRGSTFTVFLPVAGQGAQARKKGRPASADYLSAAGHEHILLVDDDPRSCKRSKRILEHSGYSVTTAGDGRLALEMFKRNPLDVDLVISNANLPKRSGEKLAAEIHSVFPAMPILLVGGSKKSSEETLMQVGVRGVLKKPVSEEEIIKRVRQTLDEE